MHVKQVDKRTALELAAKGEEILLVEPDTEKPEKWMDYSTGTLDKLLDGCLFFRREPALEKEEEDMKKRGFGSGGWIPVEDRLPEDPDVIVLVQVSGRPISNFELINALALAAYNPDDGWILEMYPEWTNPEVAAWQPLPELYDQESGGKDETECDKG